MSEDAKAAKKQRLAEALRANLRRRKAAAERGRATSDGEPGVAVQDGTAVEDKR